ncbi:hypothetical protein [Bradyrhizobium paxllaeri]|nr:hypothetical protein [Bradyrhizobium paxllaeri]
MIDVITSVISQIGADIRTRGVPKALADARTLLAETMEDILKE